MKKLRDLVPGTNGGPLVGMALRLETSEGVEFMIVALTVWISRQSPDGQSSLMTSS